MSVRKRVQLKFVCLVTAKKILLDENLVSTLFMIQGKCFYSNYIVNSTVIID